MLKAALKTKSGRSLVILGLSHVNLQRLKEGKAIKIDGNELGISVDISIFSGETEQTMAKDIAEFIGPQTEVKIDRRLTDG